jgi:hypothetical protein
VSLFLEVPKRWIEGGPHKDPPMTKTEWILMGVGLVVFLVKWWLTLRKKDCVLRLPKE